MNDTIYSAEEIVIPEELPEILKNYSHAVLTEQPSDLIAFSIKYFGFLSSVKTPQTIEPNLDELKNAYIESKGKANDDVIKELESLVPSETFEDLNNWIKFAKDELNFSCDGPTEVYSLFLALVSKDLFSIVKAAFFIFSDKKIGVANKDIITQLMQTLEKLDFRVEKSAIQVVEGMEENEIEFQECARLLGIRE